MQKSRQKTVEVGGVRRPVVMRPLDALVPYARNARTHSDAQVAQIAASIREFGWTNPVLIDEEGGIIAGHGRVLAARQLGEQQVPCIVLDGLTKTQRRAYVLADNHLATKAGWDDELLSLELADLKADGFDLAIAGFDDVDLAALAEPAEEVLNEDKIPAPPPKPVTVRGDVWLLGKHRIICGDCRSFSDVEKVMAGEKAALAVTSPPYASQRKYDESSGFKPIPPDEYVEWFRDVQSNVMTALTPNGSWVVNIKEHAHEGQRHLYVLDLVLAHVRKWGWMFVDELVWKKTGVPGSWSDRFRNDWEPIFHFAKSKGFYFDTAPVAVESSQTFSYNKGNKRKSSTGNVGVTAVSVKKGLARPGNVLEISTREVPNGIDHEAAFPPALPSFFIRSMCPKGDHVYEPFSGSGTTIIACEQTGRACHAIELSPAYVDVAVKRWQAFAGKDATLEGDGRTFAEVEAARGGSDAER